MASKATINLDFSNVNASKDDMTSKRALSTTGRGSGNQEEFSC